MVVLCVYYWASDQWRTFLCSTVGPKKVLLVCFAHRLHQEQNPEPKEWQAQNTVKNLHHVLHNYIGMIKTSIDGECIIDLECKEHNA